MHAGTLRQLLYGCAYVREIIHSLKLVDYLPIYTHKPYNNLHLSNEILFEWMLPYEKVRDKLTVFDYFRQPGLSVTSGFAGLKGFLECKVSI